MAALSLNGEFRLMRCDEAYHAILPIDSDDINTIDYYMTKIQTTIIYKHIIE